MSTEYRLYLESGPKMRTTMVHVIDLLGCVANGPTTEAALEAAPGEIERFHRFQKQYGEKVPGGKLTTVVVQHVMEGSWIGYGDPAPGFEPDFEPITEEDERVYRRRFQAMGEELLALTGLQSGRQLARKPAHGRALADIVKHVANAEPE
jgi:hypothetical protein